MALTITPKAGSTAATSQVVTPQTSRAQVSLGKPATTTARAEALKAKLSGAPVANPVAPRPAGSTARAEQYAKLQSHVTTPQQNTVTYKQPMSDIAPPPAQPATQTKTQLTQLDNNIETSKPGPDATRQSDEAQFAAFEQRERAIQKARQELQREKAQLEAEQARLIQRLRENPLSVLSENGITYDKLVELQLNQANPDPNQEIINKRLDEIQKRFDDKLAERDKQAYDNAIKQIKSDAKLLVDSDPAFETIKATGNVGEIVNLITAVFNNENVILSVEEAAELIENKLVERKVDEMKRLTSIAKIKTRLEPPAEPDNAVTAPPPQSKTLSNQGAVERPLTARERAILAFENAKNKA